MKPIFEFIGFTAVVSCFVIGLIALCMGLIAKYGDELWVTSKFNNRVLKMDDETFEKYVKLLRDFRKKEQK